MSAENGAELTTVTCTYVGRMEELPCGGEAQVPEDEAENLNEGACLKAQGCKSSFCIQQEAPGFTL